MKSLYWQDFKEVKRELCTWGGVFFFPCQEVTSGFSQKADEDDVRRRITEACLKAAQKRRLQAGPMLEKTNDKNHVPIRI